MRTKGVPPIIAIVGPTASGKSGLAIAIARKIGGEVISADSRQVYKGLDIGTGKVTEKEMRAIPHHLLDIASPQRQLSVDEWAERAEKAVTDIRARGKIAIVCGGTGLYIDTFLRGLSIPAVPPDHALRRTLGGKSVTELFAILKTADPRRAKEIDRHNPRRLIRAIEIVKALGKVPPREAPKQKFPYPIVWIGIDPTDRTLKRRIHTRLHDRIRQGMIREGQRLHGGGLSYKRMRELGLEYRFLADHLQKRITKKEMVDGLEKAIWQYAKRQRTWWKKHKDIHWMRRPDLAGVLKILR